MADVCGKIAAGALFNCAQPITGGVDDRIILINKSDIQSVVYDVNNSLIVTDIVLTASPAAVAYAFVGTNNSVDARWQLNRVKYGKNYDHEVIFKIFDDGPVTRQTIDEMAGGKFVVIQINNYRGLLDKAAFEIKGLSQGLILTAAEANKSDSDTQGAPNLTLATPDTYKEPLPPAFFFDTDYATTKAKVEALLV